MPTISQYQYIGSHPSSYGYIIHIYDVFVDGENKALRISDSNAHKALVSLFSWRGKNHEEQAAYKRRGRVFECDIDSPVSSIKINRGKISRFISYGGSRINLPTQPSYLE